MRHFPITLAAAALAAGLSFAPAATPAKADGGVLLGVGIYLGADYIVGRKCHMRYWPFNIVKKTGGHFHGKRYCRYYRKHRHY